MKKEISQMNKIENRERRRITMKYEGKFFIVGVILGCIFGFLWQGYFVGNGGIFQNSNYSLDMLRDESNQKLLSYIEGKWSSSIGDLIVSVDTDESKDFIVLEMIKHDKLERKYKIHQITNINGFMGVISLDICDVNRQCTEDDKIPIQFNKVFGKDKTITISYDSRLTYCIDSEDQCTRAFKRISY